MAGASRVIAVDPVQHRIDKAGRYNNVETFLLEDVQNAGTDLYELTKGGCGCHYRLCGNGWIRTGQRKGEKI